MDFQKEGDRHNGRSPPKAWLAFRSEQHAPQARHSEAVSSAACVGKMVIWFWGWPRILPPIALDLVLDGLSLVEWAQPGPLDSRDVDEHIFANPAWRLNNPYPFVGLNYFTVPVGISVPNVDRAQYGSRPSRTRTMLNRLILGAPIG